MSIDYHWISLAMRNNPDAGNKFQQELKNRFNLFQIVTKAPLLTVAAGHTPTGLMDPRISPPRSPPNGMLVPGMPTLKDTVDWFKSSVQFSLNREGSKLNLTDGGHNNSKKEESAKGQSTRLSGRRKSSLFGPLRQQIEAAELARTFNEHFQKFFNGRVVQRRDRIWSDGLVKLQTIGEDEEEMKIHGHDVRYPVLHQERRMPGVGVVEYVTTEMTAKEVRALWLLHPEDRRKQAWDAFMGILIIYSVLMLPMEMAFQMQDNVNDDGSKTLQHLWGLNYFDFCVDGLFLLDICLSFQITYFSDKFDAYIGTLLSDLIISTLSTPTY
jgi:hypothetical protein